MGLMKRPEAGVVRLHGWAHECQMGKSEPTQGVLNALTSCDSRARGSQVANARNRPSPPRQLGAKHGSRRKNNRRSQNPNHTATASNARILHD